MMKQHSLNASCMMKRTYLKYKLDDENKRCLNRTRIDEIVLC